MKSVLPQRRALMVISRVLFFLQAEDGIRDLTGTGVQTCALRIFVVLRLNAFLALITAAIVVSLLAPGEPGVKIARVAEGFGRTAGTIGIVIALAGIPGKAIMVSGAADRVVWAVLARPGSKRAARR